jgi:hypothetical protein
VRASAKGRADARSPRCKAWTTVAAGSVNAAARSGTLGHVDQARTRHGKPLGESAGAVHADHRAVRTKIGAALRAVSAAPAYDQRIGGEAPPRHRAVQRRADEFVAQGHGRHAARIVALIGVQIRAANADRIDADQHVVAIEAGLGRVLDFHAVRGGENEAAHPILTWR